MNKTEVEHLLDKYKAGTASEEEVALLQSWSLSYTEPETEELSMTERLVATDRIWAKLQSEHGLVKVTRLWPRIAAAVALLLMLSIGGYFWRNGVNDPALVVSAGKDIAPGKNGATLTLANGKRVVLNDAMDGQLSTEAGVTITKTKSGELIYNVIDRAGKKNGTEAFNTLETQNGEQYHLILPDGSNVWLNAASSLKYPVAFADHQRLVELRGEAYFEIAHQKLRPFKVLTRQQQIEVLGTHFNVSAYDDEPVAKNTLMEGRVKVITPALDRGETGTVILKPGEQSVLIGNKLQVGQASLEEAMAWKNGYFMFESENIRSIMRKVSRWYNIEVVYQGEVTEETFSGVVDRFANVSQILKKLSLTNRVHFKIEGRRVIVTK